MKTLILTVSLALNVTLAVGGLLLHASYTQDILEADALARAATYDLSAREGELSDLRAEVAALQSALDLWSAPRRRPVPVPGSDIALTPTAP